MSLNAWCDEDIDSTSSEVNVEVPEAQVDEHDYNPVVEEVADEAELTIDLKDAVVSFENYMLDVNELSILSREVSNTTAISRRIAAEARRIYPEFDSGISLKVYTEFPTATRLRQATESFNKGLAALIAAAAAVLLGLIWRALHWMFGGKKTDEPPKDVKAKDISKVINDGPTAKEESEVNKVLAEAAVKTSKEVETSADRIHKILAGNKIACKIVMGGDDLEIYDVRDFFKAFELFYQRHGKRDDELCVSTALSKSIHFNMDYHHAVGEVATQIYDIAHQLLQDTKDNRESILSIMNDDEIQKGLSRDVAAALKAEQQGVPFKPELYNLKTTMLNDYTVMVRGRRLSPSDALAYLGELREQAMGRSVKIRISDIKQVTQLVQKAASRTPLGVADDLYARRSDTINLLGESSAMIEDLQQLTDPTFRASMPRFTMTDDTRALVKPELNRVQDIVRCLTDISVLIQRDCEDWRRDIWKGISISEYYANFLRRLTPMKDDKGEYDIKALFMQDELEKRLKDIMGPVNTMLATDRRKLFMRIAKAAMKAAGIYERED